MKNINYIAFVFFCLMILVFSCTREKEKIYFHEKNDLFIIETDIMKIDIDSFMKIKVFNKPNGEWQGIIKENSDPHYIVINDTIVRDFNIDKSKVDVRRVENKFGKGKRITLKGTAKGPLNSTIQKILNIDIYERFPNAAQVSVIYKNISSTPELFIEKEINNSFKLDASLVNKNYNPNDFWIFQGGSYKERPNWIVPVTDDFSYQNYQGPQWDKGEVGGGVPLLDVWCKETGFFIGSLRDKPTLISLPTQVDEKGYLNIGIEYKRNNIPFDSSYTSIPQIFGVHSGDSFNALRMYAKVMEKKGFEIVQPDTSSSIYGAEWCSWGFGPNITTQKMIDVIPILKQLGIKVATIDLGWFYHTGDYIPRTDIFPDSDNSMKEFVKTFHDNNLLIDLWISPSVAGPKLQKEHPEWLIQNKNGEYITDEVFDSEVAYLCPALDQVKEYYKEFIQRAIGLWGFDGFKMDQSFINAASPCYAKSHHHYSPEESFEELPDIYKIIYDVTVSIKNEPILEICPCGMVPSFYKMPYYNLPVSSDFKSTWQIRERGKIIKALMGSRAAYFGDHVERHYKESNFASIIGVGGIPGTMFVLRSEDNADFLKKKYPGYLSPKRMVDFKKWFNIYNKFQLSKGEYLNLYDIAFDKPETHAIKKDNIIYYAFYADHWNGEIQFRGLDKDKTYIIEDYVNQKNLGEIKGCSNLPVQFENNLLVRAIPQ